VVEGESIATPLKRAERRNRKLEVLLTFRGPCKRHPARSVGTGGNRDGLEYEMAFPFRKVRDDRSKPERCLRKLLFFRAAGLVILALAGVNAAGQTPALGQSRRVLVLYSDERLIPANIIVDEAIQAAFAADSRHRIELHSEFLDTARFPGEEQRQRQWVFFREKYQTRPPDIVIAVGGDAFTFLIERQAELFTGMPIVYCSIASDPHPRPLSDSRIANVPVPDTAGQTLEMMLRFHPDARQVAVITGSAPRDRQYAEVSRESLTPFGNRVTFTWLTNLSMEQLRSELSRLPDHTLVLYLTMFQDAAGENFSPRQALDAFAPASAAPIYGHYETYVGHGIVGGSMVTFEEIGRKAAQMAIRILDGEAPQAAARSESYQPVPIFDWGQLRRWKISEQQLPPGSLVRFKEATYWERYHRIIITAASLILLETLLIVALLVQLRRRHRAESFLRESEQRMILAVDAADFGFWVRELTRNEIWASEKWRELFGFAPSERLELEHILQRLHPDDRDGLRQVLAQAIAGGGVYDTEFRLIQPDGGTRWIASHGRVEFDSHGKPLRLRGASRDFTARKESEREMHLLRQEIAHVDRISMMGQLASALAHEINQPLAAILRNSEAAELFLRNASPDLDEIRAIIADIRKDDQRAGSVIDRMRGLLKRHNLDTRLLDVGELLGDVRALVRADAAARRVKLDVAVPGDLPPVRGDRVQLQQVLLNLIINGMDALDEANREDRLVCVFASLDGAQTVEIAVSDTGRGIPADKLAHIFDPFFTTKQSGMGMGLSISRTIIEAHGGRLWSENNNDRGATFRFTLPIAEGQPDERD
jgi:PAS domain S-box-containing protein